jgi:hypothetical protein
MTVIRYADDTIVGFQHEHEAQAFLDDLKVLHTWGLAPTENPHSRYRALSSP